MFNNNQVDSKFESVKISFGHILNNIKQYMLQRGVGEAVPGRMPKFVVGIRVRFRP